MCQGEEGAQQARETSTRRRNGGETSATQYDGQLRHHGEGERSAEGDREELNGGGKVVDLYGGGVARKKEASAVGQNNTPWAGDHQRRQHLVIIGCFPI
jgi:hypothetical protein